MSLTNAETGKPVSVKVSPQGKPGPFATLEVDGGSIDLSAAHTLRITKGVKAVGGSTLDGGFRPQGTPGEDFVLTLSRAQLEIFVKGYARKEDLGIICYDPVGWWDAAGDRPVAPVAPVSACRQVKPRPGDNNDGDVGGCSMVQRGPRRGVVVLLVAVMGALAALGWRRRRWIV